MASELPLQKFEWESVIVGDKIGEGSFAKVYEAECQHVEYAVKKFKSLRDQLVTTSDEWERECRIWSTLAHPNIVRLYGIAYNKKDRSKPPLLVMERMQKSLSCHLRDTSPDKPETASFSLDAKLSVFIQVCKALLYLHNKGLVHGDLTSNNVLLNIPQHGDITVKVSDFGVSRASTGPISMSTIGTECYMPPEVSEDPPCLTHKVDMYSVGVLAIHTVTHKCLKRLSATRRTSTGLEAVREYERFSPALKEFKEEANFLLPLIEKCLDNDPQARPEAKEIIEQLKEMKSTMPKELSLSTHSMQPVYNITHNVTSNISLSGCKVKDSNLQFIGSNTASNPNYDESPSLSGMDPLQRALEYESAPDLKEEITSGSPKSADIIEDIGVPPEHVPVAEGWTTPKEETKSKVGTTPEVGATPKGGATPKRGATPKGGDTPGGGTTPKGGTHPEVGTTPKGGTQPEVGATPKGGTRPKVGATPKGGATPEVRTTPKGGTTPEVGTTPKGGATPKGGTTFEGGIVSTRGGDLQVEGTTPKGGIVSTGGGDLNVGGTTSEGGTVSTGGGDLKVGGTTPEGGTISTGGGDLKVGGTTPYNHTTSVGGTKPEVSSSETTTPPFGGTAPKGQRGGYVTEDSIKQRKKFQVIKRNSIQFKELKYKRDEQELRSYLPGFALVKDEYYYKRGMYEEEGVLTHPCHVVQLDGSLYFYSKAHSQINRMSRGGQKVEIKVPRLCTFSVAATTSPPAVHVIVRKSNQSILKVLTLNLSAPGLKNQFDESQVPSLPINVDSGDIVSVGVGGHLFAVVKILKGKFAGRFVLLGIDTNASPLKWSFVGVCPYGVDQFCNCQVLQYGGRLLCVGGRKIAMIPIAVVLPDVDKKVGFHPESWINIQDLPEHEGKVVVYRDQLLSVGGLVGCYDDYGIYSDDPQRPTGKVYVYRPDSAEWVSVTSLKFARFCPALFVANDKLFVVGGQVITNENRQMGLNEFWFPDEISEDNPEFSPHEEESYLASLGVSLNQHPHVVQGPQDYVQDPENVLWSPQAAVQGPQPTVQNPYGTVQGPQPTLQNPYGTVQGPQPTLQNPYGTVQGPQPTLQNPYGTVQGPQPTLQNPYGTVQGPQPTLQNPYGTVQGPQATARSPQATPWSPQATALQNPPATSQVPQGIVERTQGHQSDDPEELKLAKSQCLTQ